MKRLLVFLCFIPLISEAQLFGDMVKDTSKNERTIRPLKDRKGFYVDFKLAGVALVSGVSPLEYVKQSSSVQSSTNLPMIDNRSVRAIELTGIYRIKKFDFGFGINHLGYEASHIFSEQMDSKIIKENVTVSGLFLSTSYCYTLNSLFSFSLGILGGYPLFTTSSLSNKSNSSYLAGVNILANVNVHERIGLQFGFGSRYFNQINTSFDMSNITSKNGLETYDFSINENRRQALNISGAFIGVNFKVNKK